MAELASGAVSSLLGVIRNEARLLGRVKGDVQFIKEEMESMNSFLLHLARTAPPGGEHDEQVRTWMNQVRLLAQDCNNCIDLYVYRGNPDIQRAKGGLRRYLWWAPWFLQKMVAQHQAAVQLRELKERASDVGKRRLRYGVEVPPASVQQSPHAHAHGADGLKAPSSLPQLAAAPAAAGTSPPAEDADEDGVDDGHHVVALATDKSGGRMARVFLERTMEEYFEQKLREWLEEMILRVRPIPSLAIIVTPQTHDEACALARQVLDYSYVLVDIPKVHMDSEPLRPKEILYYILRELELEHAKSQQSQDQQQGGTSGQRKDDEQKISRWRAERMRKIGIYWEKKNVISEIKYTIQEMEVYSKLEVIKSKIQEVKGDELQLDLKKKDEEVRGEISNQPLEVLLFLLKIAAAASDSDQPEQAMKKKAMPSLSIWYDCIIVETAIKLKDHIEEVVVVEEEEETANKKLQCHTEVEQAAGVKQTPQICLHKAQYKNILGEVFPRNSSSKAPEQDTKKAKEITNAAIRLDGDQLKEIIDKVKQEILREVLLMAGNSEPLRDNEQANSAAKQAPNSTTPTLRLSKDPTKETKNQKDGQGQEVKDGQGEQGHQIPDSMVEETKEKIEIIKRKIKEQLKIKGIMDRIEHLLGDRVIMIILSTDEMIMDVSTWEETRDALSLLDCVGAALIITTAKSTHQAKRYCYPQWDPIEWSLVGLYNATALALTGQKMQQDTYSPQIFRNILEECKPYEFCMKIFTHALYAKPKRSNKELHELYSTLKAVSPRSFLGIAKKMFKFSYNDLPKEYKTCLLYLAIFPQGHTIRRSTLIGRWVAEGLITNEDWPTSVGQAERCFDGLINRWLIYPADIGATGKVKSCIVGAEIHGFITKIAKKQHIVETRLSHHLARHFSIFNDVQLRGSDRVSKFLKRLSGSSLSLLKVLDLEGCHCFGGKNQRYLKDICSKILLLKYLSLRGTDITQLPNEINNLHELEVLDIRQTKVPASTTKHILLLKLKRLLAGHTNTSPSTNGIDMNDKFDSVRIPYNIEKMVKMEVLSNVKASQTGNEMQDIRKLYQLRKLGVVIEDTDRHLRKLLRVISDLHECLQSLSITLPTTISEANPSMTELPEDIGRHLNLSLKVLESLSISGTTEKGQLLPLLAKYINQLGKVTLSNTPLNQADLNALAKLPMLRCVRFRHIAFTESKLTFKKDDFPNLKCCLVEGSNLTDIMFEDASTSKLEKITLSSTKIKSISKVNELPNLEELELNNNTSNNLLSVLFGNAQQRAKLTLCGTLLKQDDLQMLAKKPNMRSLVLLEKSCAESQLTFKKDEFPELNTLVVDCADVTKIEFTSGSALKLEKIVWTFTKMESLSGINDLPRLKELEFNGGPVPNEVEEATKTLRKRSGFNFKHNKPENQEQTKEDTEEEDDDVLRFPFCGKSKA